MTDATYRRPIAWKSYALTDVGNVRKINEDAVLDRPDKQIWAVADGMGGHSVGDVASAKLVEALDHFPIGNSLCDLVDALEFRVHTVNAQLIEYAKRKCDGCLIGSTLVSLLVKGQSAACMWAGDSRLYRMRGQRLQQISRDHSQVQEWVDQGMLSEEQAREHPQANVITRAVGVEPSLYVDFEAFRVFPGDTLMLCSDGVSGVLTEVEIIDLLKTRDVKKSAEALIQAALDAGSKDNVSVVVVKAEPGPIAA